MEDNKFPTYEGAQGTKFFTDGQDVCISKGDRGAMIPMEDLIGWQKHYLTWQMSKGKIEVQPNNFGRRTIADMTDEEFVKVCSFFIKPEEVRLASKSSQKPTIKIEMTFREVEDARTEHWVTIDAAFDIRWERRTPGRINTSQIYGQMKIVKYLLERGFAIFG